MPVDHPAAAPETVRRAPARMLYVAIGFLLTFASLHALGQLLSLSTTLS